MTMKLSLDLIQSEAIPLNMFSANIACKLIIAHKNMNYIFLLKLVTLNMDYWVISTYRKKINA